MSGTKWRGWLRYNFHHGGPFGHIAQFIWNKDNARNAVQFVYIKFKGISSILVRRYCPCFRFQEQVLITFDKLSDVLVDNICLFLMRVVPGTIHYLHGEPGKNNKKLCLCWRRHLSTYSADCDTSSRLTSGSMLPTRRRASTGILCLGPSSLRTLESARGRFLK